MSKLYDKLLRPALFNLPAETAHEIGINALRVGLGLATARSMAAGRFATEPFGKLQRFGLTFKNPVGMAAGFDKNAVVSNQLAALGFGFVEVGTLTFEPQPGNDRPRMFRLPLDKALINRLGFNNEGVVAAAERLSHRPRECIVGINIGKNRDVAVENAVENYLRAFEVVHPAADYIAINVSSPNTPGLRDLQHGKHLEELLSALQRRNREMGEKPLLVKVAPDLEEADINEIVGLCLDSSVAGIIAANTTIDRSGLKTPGIEAIGPGGLSGRPLAERSNRIIAAIHRNSHGKMPVIGVGGIFDAADAFAKIAAGACLLQAYTGFVYNGIGFARDINLGLAAMLKDRGFSSLDDAVGSGVR